MFFGTPNIIHSAPKLEDPGRDQSEKVWWQGSSMGICECMAKTLNFILKFLLAQIPTSTYTHRDSKKGTITRCTLKRYWTNVCVYIYIWCIFIYIYMCLTLYNITTSTTWNVNEKSCQTYEFIIIHIIRSLYYLQLQPSEGKWTSIYLLWFRNSWCPCWWELVMPHLSWLKKKAQLLQDPVLGTCWASWAFFAHRNFETGYTKLEVIKRLQVGNFTVKDYGSQICNIFISFDQTEVKRFSKVITVPTTISVNICTSSMSVWATGCLFKKHPPISS